MHVRHSPVLAWIEMAVMLLLCIAVAFAVLTFLGQWPGVEASDPLTGV